jgi:hypothetical protein
MTLDLLDEQQAYIDWLRSEHSCLLLLSGVTMAGGRLQGGTATYSWLSPATIYIAERIQQEQKVLAYYCCHPELRADERPAVADVIPSIIFQILMRKPDILRHKSPSFLSIVSEWQQHVQKSKDDRRLINLMVQLLREVLAEFKDTGMVYIILDRVDQCSCRTRYLMDELAKLVGDGSYAVKIVTVIAEEDGDEWDVDNLDEKVSTHVMRKIGWRQQKNMRSQ